MANHATRSSKSAILVIDVINDLEFPGGEKLLPWAKDGGPAGSLPAARCRANIPIIYANDNFGHWRSDFKAVVAHCMRDGARGRDVLRQLLPHDEDYFMLKPKHSAFFATSLVPLLEFLQVERLIVAGIATNLCVLFTAHDAHMHEFEITVLSDCCAAESDEDHNWALDQLKQFLGVKVCLGEELQFSQG